MKIAICGDWPLWMDLVTRDIRAYMDLEGVKVVVDNFYSGKDLLLTKFKYNIIFLDAFSNREKNGVFVANKIRTFNENVKIVFISSSMEYLKQLQQVGIYKYISKDFGKNVICCLREYIEDLKKTSMEQIVVFWDCDKKVDITLKISQIFMIESIKKGSYVYTQNGVFRSNKILVDCIEELEDKQFCQCHRRYVVNLLYVDNVYETTVTISTYKAEISSRRRKEFLHKLMAYNSNKNSKKESEISGYIARL